MARTGRFLRVRGRERSSFPAVGSRHRAEFRRTQEQEQGGRGASGAGAPQGAREGESTSSAFAVRLTPPQTSAQARAPRTATAPAAAPPRSVARAPVRPRAPRARRCMAADAEALKASLEAARRAPVSAATRSRNAVTSLALLGFVGGVYYYTMHAVKSTDLDDLAKKSSAKEQ